ncbi:MAG: hypothetical protein DMG31_15170 [Acidobacteria bacterium]|nr:MAG: hypothetical protein DMG31_15170 [Acidobacteriota bacterium]
MRCAIAVELAEKGWTVFRRPVSQVRNEVFDLFSRGISQVRGTAEIGGISFDQIGIELMLADQEAKAIAESGVTVLMTSVDCGGSGSLRIGWTIGLRFPAEFLDRTEADTVSFPKSAIDGSGFSHAHFGTPNERRNIRRISITITRESTGTWRFVDCSPKNPAAL